MKENRSIRSRPVRIPSEVDRRPRDRRQKYAALDSISLHESGLQDSPKNHFLRECADGHQENPWIDGVEVRSHLRRCESSKAMRCPLRSVKNIPSQRNTTGKANSDGGTERGKPRFGQPNRSPSQVPSACSHNPQRYSEKQYAVQ
jgi:hypothetical protein